MKIDHISVSRNQTWETCRKQYRYKYHEHTTPDFPTPVYFTFGKIVHTIIEHYTKSRGATDIKEIQKAILSGELDLEPGQKAPALGLDQRSRLNNHIRNFLRFAEKSGLDGEVEYAYLIDLDPPHKRMFKGFIDRLIIKDDSIFIIDYKTTKPSPWRKDSRTITKDLQLQSYCWVAMTKFNIKPEKIKAALYYLEDAKLVPARFSEATLLSVPKQLLDVHKVIEQTPPDEAHGRVGRHCNFCDFRITCPYNTPPKHIIR